MGRNKTLIQYTGDKKIRGRLLAGLARNLLRCKNMTGRGTVIAAGFLALFLIIAIPKPVSAGFFSDLLKLFGRANIIDSKPALINESEASSGSNASLLSAAQNPDPEPDQNFPNLDIFQESALVAPANPLGTMQERPDQDQIFIYIVKPGDTPSSIAKSFSISANTIMWANSLTSGANLKAGSQIVILPVSGVKYVVKKGDTIQSIAKKYSGDVTEILAFNGLATGASLDVGSEVIIPNGELSPSEAKPTPAQSQRYASLPNLMGYFLRPIQGGRKTQGIHGSNGVDLASACGSAIFSAANGTVLLVRNSGWNGGFGNFLVINHPNGTQTLYAHNQKILVTPGESVTQGQLVALVGNTGNTRGVTGCHVHFEIHGAKNPF